MAVRENEPPDLVGEELGDHARIWRVCDRVARVNDQERIGNWNRGLDNLALFAGLFSAVTTAFIIQLQNDTRPDYAELTFRVLNATAAGQPFVQGAFVIDSSVRLTNYLWIMSLMLSLTAALIAIMGKDWITMYASRPVCNPRQWAEMRTYRLLCVERWYMPAVIASAPVLLHLSLVLFAAGLVLFFSPDPLSQRLALGLSIAAGSLYCVTVLSSIVFSGSPFKSPATQAVRGAISALLVLLCNAPQHKLQILSHWRQAVLFRAQLLPIYIASLDQVRHSQRWRIRIRLDCIRHISLRETLRLCMRAIRGASAALLLSISRRIHVLPALLSWKMRTLLRWLHNRDIGSDTQALQIRLHEILLSTRWVDASITPSPELLSSSIFLLNDRSPTPEALHATIVALGDMAIGRDVAPLISHDLQTRIGEEIRQRWHVADLNTFSRYILAERNIFPVPIVEYERAVTVLTRVANNPPLRSENLFFAYARSRPSLIESLDIILFCPVAATQPRTLQYMLPHLAVDTRLSPCLDCLILLASRYWDPIHHAQSFDLENTLFRVLNPEFQKQFESQTKSRYGNKSGLLELLTFLLANAVSPPEPIQVLIIRSLGRNVGYASHPCLVYAFGTNTTWTTLPWSPAALFNFPQSIPLLRYRCMRWDSSDTPLANGNDHSFEFALARIVIGTLTSNKTIMSRTVLLQDDDGFEYRALELGIRCLHTLLCHPRSMQPPEAKAELIRLILEKTVLNNSTILDRYGPDIPWPPERCVLNILTVIAGHLAHLLNAPETFDTGSHLFAMFSFSEGSKDRKGNTVFWDLGVYLRDASTRISDHGDDDPGADVSMRRLKSAIRALQPCCMARDDLRAAWERIGLAADPYKNGPYWNCDVGSFLALAEAREGEESVGVDAPRRMDYLEQMAQATPEDYALLCLEGSMG